MAEKWTSSENDVRVGAAAKDKMDNMIFFSSVAWLRAAHIAVTTGLCVALIACSGQDQVEVYVLPAGYTVGAVSSVIATDAVSEVVRLRPRSVLIRACTKTPSGWVSQFIDELQARHKVDVQLRVHESCDVGSIR